MNFRFGKMFRYKDYEKKSIKIIDYNPEDESNYYAFIKKQSDNGYIQIIINSNIMMFLLKYYFIERKFTITSILFTEEDEKFVEECTKIIEKVNNDRAHFVDLIDQIKFLSNEDCIEIFKISLRGKKGNDTIRIEIQANGITKINENKYNEEACYLKDKLESYIYAH